MEQAAAQLAQDNCELACCFIQKTAVEKAGPEMDKRLATVSMALLKRYPVCSYTSIWMSKRQCGVCVFGRNLSSGSMLGKRGGATAILLC